MKSHHPTSPRTSSSRTLCALVTFFLTYAFASAATVYKPFTPGHYVYCAAPDMATQSISDYLNATTGGPNDPRVFRGLQRTIYWKDIETSYGVYNFAKVDAALAMLNPGQKLIIQFSFKSWASADGSYEFPTYIHDNNNGNGPYGNPYAVPAGSGNGYYVHTETLNHYPFIWNQQVKNRMIAALQALGAAYDDNPAIECINMCESATGGATSSPLNLVGDDEYGDAIVALFIAMKAAFPNTRAIQYANFPKSQQFKYAAACIQNNVGWGGPDIVQQDVRGSITSAPTLIGTNENPGTYAFYKNHWSFSSVTNYTIGNKVVKGTAVQNEDYDWSNGFESNFLNARDALAVNYMFWQAQFTIQHPTRNPQVIDFVKSKVQAHGPVGGLNATVPLADRVTTTFVSEATYDGWVLESGENSNAGGSNYSTGTGTNALLIGDDASKKQYRSILSFDTSNLPDGAEVVSATLKMKRSAISNNPSAFGSIQIDAQTYGINSNIALENADFQSGTTVSPAGSMSYPASNGTWSTGTLNASGRSAVNKVGRTQLRVYFTLGDDNDAKADFLGFYSGDNGTAGNRPVLEITYQ